MIDVCGELQHQLSLDASGRFSLQPSVADQRMACIDQDADLSSSDQRDCSRGDVDGKSVQNLVDRVAYFPGSQDIESDVRRGLAANKETLDKLDKNSRNNKIVVIKQQSMEELILALERALSVAKQPLARADEVINYVKTELENIQNPHRALEEELARLVAAKKPPNDEFYKTRSDKNEFAVAFFYRVYGRFYEAGVLYKHQVRAMDFSFYESLSKAKDAPHLLIKKDETDSKLQKIAFPGAIEIKRLASALASRERRA